MADKVIVKQFVIDNPFGVIVSTNNGRPIATHIPFEFEEIDGKWFLEGHISKANKQWRVFNSDTDVLCIFQSEHAYVSSSWYSFLEVPTWNYMAAHLYGKVHVLNEADLFVSLNKMVRHYEHGRPNAFKMEQFDNEAMRKKMRGIVGFRIEVSDFEANFKLSQNRSDKDYQNIISQLKNEGDAQSVAIAKAMEAMRR